MMLTCDLDLCRPDDRFEIILKPRTDPDEQLEWRLKCLGEFSNAIPC